jgi:ribosomal protein L40E
MDFLEDLFDFGDRKRQNRNRSTENGDHHDDHHDDDNDDRQHYATGPYPQNPTNTAAFLPGIVCRKCSTQTIQGAKFCHACGTAIETALNCASCGSKLPANALFCSQCGYKNG